jgi:protein phosphatase
LFLKNIIIFGCSDTGLIRTNNEDAYYFTGNVLDSEWEPTSNWFEFGNNLPVFILADGMGGENAGEVASELAIFSIHQYLKNNLSLSLNDLLIKNVLEEAILHAHHNIIQQAFHSPLHQGMGTTAVVACIMRQKLYVSWIGDSRLYVFTSEKTKNFPRKNKTGRLQLISDDHSIVWEEVMNGNMTAEQARISHMSNVITQSLGDPISHPVPGFQIIDLYEEDTILMCSDGLNGMLSDQRIEGIFKQHENASLQNTAHELVMQAKKEGGKDNITIILSKLSSIPHFSNEPVIINHNNGSEISKTFKFDHVPYKRKNKNKIFIRFIFFIFIVALLGMVYYIYNATIEKPIIRAQEKQTKTFIPQTLKIDSLKLDSILCGTTKMDTVRSDLTIKTRTKIK